MEEHEIKNSIRLLANAIHNNAKEHGWWEEKRSFPELLCLVHSEVSEALEGYRNNDIGNMAEELADIVIRVFDIAEGFSIDIAAFIWDKHQTNRARPFKHGGKRI